MCSWALHLFRQNGRFRNHYLSSRLSRWREICNKRSKSAKFRPKGANTNDEISIHQARVYIGGAIDVILKMTQEMKVKRHLWSTDSDPLEHRLYETFRGAILKSPSPILPRFETKPTGYGLQEVTVDTNAIISWEEGKPLTRWFSFLSRSKYS